MNDAEALVYDAQKLRRDLTEVRKTGRDIDICDALETLLEQGYLRCRWDVHKNRRLRIWMTAGKQRPDFLPIISTEIRELMIELLLDGELVISTEVNRDKWQVQWMSASAFGPACAM